MPGPHLTAPELADELGRSTHWLYEHWRDLGKSERMPAPLHAGKSPLVWNRAQIYAWLDRKLSRTEREAAAAFRAAAAAAAEVRITGDGAVEDAEWRAKLDAHYAGGVR